MRNRSFCFRADQNAGEGIPELERLWLLAVLVTPAVSYSSPGAAEHVATLFLPGDKPWRSARKSCRERRGCFGGFLAA